MNTKFNFIKADKGMLKWKQIEVKDNSVFMRFKQRIYLRDKHEE